MPGESLLVIDDDEFMRDLLSESLTEAGFYVAVAETGQEGLEHLNHRLFHVVLLDLSLPDMDGMAVVDSIASASPETQIVIMTGYPSLETAIDALRGGAQDYLVKPFKVPEALASVTRAVNQMHLRTEVQSLRGRVADLEQEVNQLRSARPGAPQPGTRPGAPSGAPTGAYGSFRRAPEPEESDETS